MSPHPIAARGPNRSRPDQPAITAVVDVARTGTPLN